MLASTLATIETVIRADTSVGEEQTQRILEACRRSSRPGRRVTVRKAAEVLGVHPRTISRYVQEGKLHAIRLSKRRIRYDLNEVERFAMNGVG